MTMVELCVHMCCGGCEAKVKKALLRVKGVDHVEVDMVTQKVTVTGWADQKKVLKAARKTSRRAVLWPYGAGDYGQPFMQNESMYMQHPACGPGAASSYNYRKHGYDDAWGYGHNLRRGSSNNFGERARAFFSDENPNACSIM